MVKEDRTRADGLKQIPYVRVLKESLPATK